MTASQAEGGRGPPEHSSWPASRHEPARAAGTALRRDRAKAARFELSLEAARRPELRADLRNAGLAARSRATALLAALGAPRPAPAADLLVAWTDGLLYDRLAGALATTRPLPDVTELTTVVRRMLEAALST
ncbi:hypothetical protein SGFS_103780 [Streptomyces graminofaciens]|uniref:Tetracyclin repressor-like C-terminal group 31 domain-containing protein n=1 Tax=Streptomyces graminofaciens TaxID=68212 RepID=A0ABN5W091_9ACTN|nr:hypothetical protein [Streptomyces graminofaciens]BBC39084.1 hypothetical protein SGFS_103780 [Streptomyces graminofaciens]